MGSFSKADYISISLKTGPDRRKRDDVSYTAVIFQNERQIIALAVRSGLHICLRITSPYFCPLLLQCMMPQQSTAGTRETRTPVCCSLFYSPLWFQLKFLPTHSLSSKGPRLSGFPQSTMDNLWSLFINCPIKCSVHLLFIDMVEGGGFRSGGEVYYLKAR